MTKIQLLDKGRQFLKEEGCRAEGTYKILELRQRMRKLIKGGKGNVDTKMYAQIWHEVMQSYPETKGEETYAFIKLCVDKAGILYARMQRTRGPQSHKDIEIPNFIRRCLNSPRGESPPCIIRRLMSLKREPLGGVEEAPPLM